MKFSHELGGLNIHWLAKRRHGCEAFLTSVKADFGVSSEGGVTSALYNPNFDVLNTLWDIRHLILNVSRSNLSSLC
jgi:hypothetical protein